MMVLLYVSIPDIGGDSTSTDMVISFFIGVASFFILQLITNRLLFWSLAIAILLRITFGILNTYYLFKMDIGIHHLAILMSLLCWGLSVYGWKQYNKK
ncbi:hypothetical protein [Vibrio sp. SS-MA-C1-2]|uniref:hypothetical protein n=1 Tax=Vibrio sp. SS-MA-C1-2 TaxID=2908646 RepID=UPI001F32AAA8|nr:hypothetical protein [Vibrio sp. SS-MA-C1-2]